MAERNSFEEQVWESGWETHTVAQRRRMAALTLLEKLDWLESAHQLVLQLESSRRSPMTRPKDQDRRHGFGPA